MIRGKADLPQASEGAYSAKHVKNGKSAKPSRMHQPPICCPECGSRRVWKDGVRHTRLKPVQRWLCRSCGFRFSESTQDQVKVHISRKSLELLNPGSDLAEKVVRDRDLPVQKHAYGFPFLRGEDVGSHKISPNITNVGKGINTHRHYNSKYRVGVSESEAKNLVKVESRIEKQAAGATTTSDAEVKGKIVEFLWWLKKKGYAPSTIRSRYYKVQRLARLGADLFNPENVKEVIARQTTWGNGAKQNATVAYSSFLDMLGLEWEPPRYKVPDSLPFIPLESEIDALINNCGKKMACFLQGLKDTGADPGELARLEWTDINNEAKSVTIRHPVKGHNARVVSVSDSFLGRLSALPKTGLRVFCNVRGLQSNFIEQRRRIAHNLANPRILKITFITLRHWKGTMEYHRTKDILHVKRILGHKTLKSTMVYVNLEQALFQAESDEFHFKVAETLEEAGRLIEAGFDYVGRIHGAEVFRKRK